jgi:hypothetical protein
LHGGARSRHRRRQPADRADGSPYSPTAPPPAAFRVDGDPRRSIIERYPNAETYVAAIAAASRQLVEEGLMLEEDAEHATTATADWGGPRHDIKLK